MPSHVLPPPPFSHHLPFQVFAEVGMRDADQGAGALGNRLALEIDHAELGDDIHHIGARRRYDIALRQVEHNATATFTTLVVSRWQADEGDDWSNHLSP